MLIINYIIYVFERLVTKKNSNMLLLKSAQMKWH